MRVFPLSNWTELDVWEYVLAENIPVVPLYFSKLRPVVERAGALIMVDDDRLPLMPGEQPAMRRVRFRTLGCYPLTGAIESEADTLRDIVAEMRKADHLRAPGPADRLGRSLLDGEEEARGLLLMAIAVDPAALPTLRLLTCGSVDDGKSTLIGRLLYEKKLIFDDQLSTLKRDSKKFGTTGDDIDFALLVDGLEAEREQGITIDVAYRYFATERRSFIVADTPGHEQYTRNMATGASNADLAIVLVDARKGLLTQTHRHSIIVSLLGMRHVVLAVNKIDLVDYSETVFRQIEADYRKFAGSARLPLADRASDLGPPRRQCLLAQRAHALVVGAASARLSRADRGRGGSPQRALSFAGAMGQPAASGFPRLRRHDPQRTGGAGRPDRRRRFGP